MAVSILSREPFALVVIVAQLKCAIKQTFHINFFANRLTSSRCLALFNEVAPAKFFWSQSDRLRDFVHVTFQPKDTLRRAESAKGSVRRHVRRHGFAMDANVRTKVWTSSVNRAAREHDGRKRAICATIDHKVDLHRQELSVSCHGSLVLHA